MRAIENFAESLAEGRGVGLLDASLEQVGGLEESGARHAGAETSDEVKAYRYKDVVSSCSWIVCCSLALPRLVFCF